MGVLSNGTVVHKVAGDFIGEFQGKSVANTARIVKAAAGKVLIIDEAPGLTRCQCLRLHTGSPLHLAAGCSIVRHGHSGCPRIFNHCFKCIGKRQVARARVPCSGFLGDFVGPAGCPSKVFLVSS